MSLATMMEWLTSGQGRLVVLLLTNCVILGNLLNPIFKIEIIEVERITGLKHQSPESCAWCSLNIQKTLAIIIVAIVRSQLGVLVNNS